MMKRLAVAFLYGDLFERVVYRTRPYEQEAGAVDRLHQEWLEKLPKMSAMAPSVSLIAI